MRIVIDGACWPNCRGFGRFARGVVHALAAAAPAGDEIVLLADAATAARPDLPARCEIAPVHVDVAPTQAAAADGSRSLRDIMAFRRAAGAARGDVMFFPAVYSWFPAKGPAPTVVTFHDAIAESLPRLIFPTRRGEFFWRLKSWLARRQAAAIVAPSATARAAVAKTWHVPEAQITIVSAGVDTEVFHPRQDAAATARVDAQFRIPSGARVLLAVGGLSPHKNLDRLVLALAALKKRGVPDLKLVLVGADREDVFFSAQTQLRALVTAENLADSVIFTGFVSDDVLATLYRRASALVFPSLMEGFGLPALEALASGTPVLASRRGSLPEILGDAGLFFDAENVDDIARAIDRLLDDPDLRAACIAKGLVQARLYSWESAATTLLQLFQRVARK